MFRWHLSFSWIAFSSVMLISDTVLSLLILRLSWTRWLIFSLTSTHVTASGHRERPSETLARPNSKLHTVVAILNSHSSTNFTTFEPYVHKNWNIGRCCFLVHLNNGAAILNVSQCWHYSKGNENYLHENEGKLLIFFSAVLTFRLPFTHTHTHTHTQSLCITDTRNRLHSSIGVALGYGLEIGVLGFDSQRGLGILTTASRTAMGPT
jgi:hypothetical protein